MAAPALYGAGGHFAEPYEGPVPRDLGSYGDRAPDEDKNHPVMGQFMLTFEGETTEPLSYNASAQAVEDALNHLHAVEALGGVDVYGATGGPYGVVFKTSEKVSPITGDPYTLEPASKIEVKEFELDDGRPHSFQSIYISRDFVPADAEKPLLQELKDRVAAHPFNLVATIIFVLAVAHTFAAGYFNKLAHKFEEQHKAKMRARGTVTKSGKEVVSFKATLFHFLGEVEAIFGIWVIPLVLAIEFIYGWSAVTGYIDFKVKYTEPMFVVVIMAIASTRPVILFSRKCLQSVARIGHETPAAWWLSILIIAPILGSFITEPAAMTIAAMLLGQQFYALKPPSKMAYATIGLLFVNVSVGGTLTHFSAPPVLMVAGTWHWDMAYMFTHFGWKAFVGIVIATAIYFAIFRKEFAKLKDKEAERRRHGEDLQQTDEPIPVWIICVHLMFLAWTVFTLHDAPLFIGGFLFFLAFIKATEHHQFDLSLRNPLLVGFFLAGLVTHGTLQGWWIEPVLSRLSEFPLFIGATVLTAFNDNAAITFLASLVPQFAGHEGLQQAVVAGAVTGGGLTVIANAPNPAGQSLLQKYFDGGVSPLKLLLAALVPTLVMALCFQIL